MKNNNWTEPTPITTPANRREVNLYTYEATLGGFVLKDKLWFFAGREAADVSTPSRPAVTRIGYTTDVTDTRYEGKLTFRSPPSHRLVGSYIKRDQRLVQLRVLEPDRPAETGITAGSPRRSVAGNYSGVITDSFFVEAQYSQRNLEFLDSGARTTDRSRHHRQPGRCRRGTRRSSWPQPGVLRRVRPRRDPRQQGLHHQGLVVPVPSPKWGSHDIRFGYDRFHDQRFSNNYQSGSGFVAGATNFRYEGTN